MGLSVGSGRVGKTTGHPSEIIRMPREIRIEKSVSLINLAIDTDLHENSLSDYERGIREPSLLTVERWAKSLGYELDLHPIGE